MQTYHVKLESPVFTTYRCQRAANSLDIDSKKKSIHDLKITADLSGPFNVCLILGSSGSGKTTLAKHIFGENIFKEYLNLQKPVIEQFPEALNYEECAGLLAGVGLTAVTCWIRPAYTLSNGQRARAEAALAMAQVDQGITVIDEWTSVVDRTVAKVMSHCVQKAARRQNRKLILLSCHYDVVEWLDPDLIIDCNSEKFIDRRLLQPDERRRKEQIQFDICEVGRDTWRYFSKYHYLSEDLPGGKIETFGLFHKDNQIGFQCFANYVPKRKGKTLMMHSNRTVIHPDYAGLGLGIRIIDETSKIIFKKGYDVRAKFSSMPIFKAMKKSPYWKLLAIEQPIGRIKITGDFGRNRNNNNNSNYGFRTNVTTYSFKFTGDSLYKSPKR